MIKEIDLRVLPEQAADIDQVQSIATKEVKIAKERVNAIRIVKRSIDARQRQVMINLRVAVYIDEQPEEKTFNSIDYSSVQDSPSVIIVGAGPAGLFAALRMIELGIKPIIVERGKNVRDRKRDLAQISTNGIIDPDSNYAFGEGGAGAYSDGKLYTRSKKRGSVERILNILCQFGANPQILVDAHPHIGTDKLPRIIENIRNCIIEKGGEVHFETRMDDLIVEDDQVNGIITHKGDKMTANAVLLATGHSARDVYKLLHKHHVLIESKSIAMGVRLEHPQSLIDQIQYHNPSGRGAFLPPAEYSFVQQVEGRGVYSFCMCPGGVIVPAASNKDQLVVNGMSSSNRGGRWANSGFVVEIHPQDISPNAINDPLCVMNYQEQLENEAYKQAGLSQQAPAQRMVDFVEKHLSKELNSTSYAPGLKTSPMHQWLPKHISERLSKAFVLINNRNKGFLTNQATLIGLESRTSSPIRIPRDNETLCHIRTHGLYPCGEGAGYAGGIVSAAIDGERCAEAIYNKIHL